MENVSNIKSSCLNLILTFQTNYTKDIEEKSFSHTSRAITSFKIKI